ncbi:MAG: hypothetical protein JSR60_19195 [Proteobacteria bacterium]|nr:hypothetical protein [Pseudomonadota bacterium]
MAARLERLADSLELLHTRLRREAAEDDGALREKFGGAFNELAMLRDVVRMRLARGETTADFTRIDRILAEIAATFDALPHQRIEPVAISRPLARRRRLHAERLDASTRKLLRRAAVVIGLTGASAATFGLPAWALPAGCLGTTSVICDGLFTAGILAGDPVTSLDLNSMTGPITPASGTSGVVLQSFGYEGTHHGAGATGEQGGPSKDLTLIVRPTEYAIVVSGDNTYGVMAGSFGGGAGNGGGGAPCPIPCISGGNAGGGGKGGNVTLTNFTNIYTNGTNAAGVYAISHGGQGGDGGDSNGGPSSGSGGPGGDAGTVSVTNNGAISTQGFRAHGIFAAAIGGNGGGGGSGVLWSSGGNGGIANVGGDVTVVNNASGTIYTQGDNAIGIYGESVGGFGGSGGNSAGLFGFGGGGSLGGDSKTVTITNHAGITTLGVDAYAIFAQSIGGGGGNGGGGVGIVGLGASGDIGGKADAVSVTNDGLLETWGEGARGIFAQSIGGGGGNGGSGSGLAGIGGTGSGTSPGGTVYVQNDGDIYTHGDNKAYAIEAQSIGGGGGDGGSSTGLVTVGGDGGAGGDAKWVTVHNTGSLSTTGSDSSAIFAQSVGGGGGNGGNAVAVSAQLAFALGGKGGPGGNGDAVTVTSDTGTIITGGDRSNGIQAQSIGGGGGNGGFAVAASAGLYFSLSAAIGGRGGHGGNALTVDLTNYSDITTYGSDSHGLFVQSVGGGGGSGGLAIALAGSNGIAGTFAMGGHGEDGGDADVVHAYNYGAIYTFGYHSYGILAQSVGGGGGDGGLSISGAAGMNGALAVSVGGSSGGGGLGKAVYLTNTGFISTIGDESVGVMAQSVGGGGGTGGGAISGAISDSAAFSIGIGGGAGAGEDSDIVELHNSGGVQTEGKDAHGVVAQSIGGGGGNGGFAVGASLSNGVAGTATVGGTGGFAGNAMAVTLTSADSVLTLGDHAFGIFAQSVGGGGGDGGFAASGALSGDANATIGIGGKGAGGGTSGIVRLTSDSQVETWGIESYGILAQSVGGGGGTGGLSLSAGGSESANLGVSVGGDGDGGGDGNEVYLTSNDLVTTHGNLSTAILAQSVGGGGGSGGGSVAFGASEDASLNFAVGGKGAGAGAGQYVELTNNGGATTWGDEADGVVAQSIGGGGGNGGFAVVGTLSKGYSGSIGIGGTGSGGGDGGEVYLHGDGAVQTDGFKSYGIIAQSIGGGGGNGGFSVAGSVAENASAAFAIGGNGGVAGDGKHVTLITASNVLTMGAASLGIIAQSVGGGGGNGGFAVAGNISEGNSIGGLTVGVGGKGNSGGSADRVDLTSSGTVITLGDESHAVVAQSIGGGGGNGGFGGAYTISLGDGANATFGVGGNGAGGGNGGLVFATTSGIIETAGDGSYGVLAQSVGGGGGDGGWGMAVTIATGDESKGSITAAIGGTGGGGGFAQTVTLINTASVLTTGSHSYGLSAESLGGGGGNGGFAASGTLNSGTDAKIVGLTVGGAGGIGNYAGAVILTNSGQISTTGDAVDPTGGNTGTDAGQNKTGSIGILAQSIGGGGGNGGGSYSGVIAGPDNKDLNVAVGGLGGGGGYADTVTVRNLVGGDIETDGGYAYGILAQSIGGGGGNGGMAISAVLSKNGEGTNVNMGVSVGGLGGDGNYAQLVDVLNNAVIITHGTHSSGIIAQSIGGGGGNGGAAVTAVMGVTSGDPADSKSRTFNVSASIGGGGGDGSNGGQVIVNNTGGITTWGDQSEGINAQSIGGGGGTGGNANTMSFIVAGQCTAPLICGSPDSSARNLNLQATVGGNGGGASDGDTVTVNNSGIIVTHGEDSDGIFAQSIGGGGGTGGNGTLGSGGLVPFVPLEFTFLPVSNVKLWRSIGIAVGGNAGATGNGKLVTVDNENSITTYGANSSGIVAQSVGGGGGWGGTAASGLFGLVGIGGKGGAGGNGGQVMLTNNGAIDTTGDGAYGIFAQSVGGGGGTAGNVKRGLSQILGTKNAVGLGLAFGQGGGDGGDGDIVTVTSAGNIYTQGAGAHGIFAQSVGGGGGELGDLGNGFGAGLQLLDFFVGSIGDKGDGKAVTVTQSGTITTDGSGAAGIFAQSAGGQGTGGDLTITLNGALTTHGDRAIGILAQSAGLNGGGVVKVLGSSTVTTTGDDAVGILAESFGAASLEDNQVVATQLAGFLLPYLTGTAIAGPVTVTRGGTIHTTGSNSDGIVAHSVSSLGDAGLVTVNYSGSITVAGSNADAIVVQSTGVDAAHNGNIAVNLTGTGTISGGLGDGAAVRFIDGNTNVLNNYASVITAKDLAGNTVVGGDGNEAIENYGVFGGGFALGAGSNSFNNHVSGTILAGALLDMGGPANTLHNDGSLSPGHLSSIYTSEIDGSYAQSITGNLAMDVDWSSLTADRLNITGTASLAGHTTLTYLNIPSIRPGTTDFTLLHADGGATDSGLTLIHQQSAIVDYNLGFPNADEVHLTVSVDFSPNLGGPLNHNDRAIGDYINRIQTAGSDPSLAPLIDQIFTIPDAQGLHAFYRSLSPEPFLATQYAAALAGSSFNDAMLSCHPYASSDGFRFTAEGTCTWLRVTPKTIYLDPTFSTMGSRTIDKEVAGGHQQIIDEHFVVGAAFSYSDTDSNTENYSSSHGHRIAGGLVVKALFDPFEVAVAVNGGDSILRTDRNIGFPAGTVAHSRQENSFVSGRIRGAMQAWDDGTWYVRPLVDLNITQLHTGGFTETGAGALNLVVAPNDKTMISLAGGAEFGGEIRFNETAVFRPFVSYQFLGMLDGRNQEITAGFEGAPAGILPFTVNNATNALFHQVGAGFDFIRSDDLSVRVGFNGLYGSRSHEEVYSVKIALPF